MEEISCEKPPKSPLSGGLAIYLLKRISLDAREPVFMRQALIYCAIGVFTFPFSNMPQYSKGIQLFADIQGAGRLTVSSK